MKTFIGFITAISVISVIIYARYDFEKQEEKFKHAVNIMEENIRLQTMEELTDDEERIIEMNNTELTELRKDQRISERLNKVVCIYDFNSEILCTEVFKRG
jgi:hypothetical protein